MVGGDSIARFQDRRRLSEMERAGAGVAEAGAAGILGQGRSLEFIPRAAGS